MTKLGDLQINDVIKFMWKHKLFSGIVSYNGLTKIVCYDPVHKNSVQLLKNLSIEIQYMGHLVDSCWHYNFIKRKRLTKKYKFFHRTTLKFLDRLYFYREQTELTPYLFSLDKSYIEEILSDLTVNELEGLKINTENFLKCIEKEMFKKV